MAKRHNFDELFGHYPAVIGEMDEVFGSHAFILRLAHLHHRLFIDTFCVPFLVPGILGLSIGGIP
jgi:hypothetical protein